jgi:hypothetical protein
MMQGKVASLTLDLAHRRLLLESGDDLFEMLKQAQENSASLGNQLAQALVAMSSSDEKLRALETKLEAQKQELENTKDCLVLVETTLADMNGSVKAQKTLLMIQSMWAVLGVDETIRKQVRAELENCIADTCDRHLSQVSKLKSSTEEEIAVLKAKKLSMQSALSLSESKETRYRTLLEEVYSLRDEVGKLEVVFNAANSRREHIISAMISLSATLGIRRNDLPVHLKYLMQQLDEGKPSSRSVGRLRRASIMENIQAMVDSISNEFRGVSEADGVSMLVNPSGVNYLPQGCLDEEFLGNCEDDIAELRVKKSEMLAKNRERVQKIREIARSLHSAVPELVGLVEMTLHRSESPLPIWWDSDHAAELLKKTIATSPRADSENADLQYIQLIHEALDTVAGSRQRISSVLREMVEKAQQALLDIVGRELDASEAYASFREAMLKLPALTEDFSQSCISEMEALVAGIEAMTQSEIETLSVVWEALKVSSDERREFWGRIDEQQEALVSPSDDRARFDQLLQPLTASRNVERWVMSAISTGKAVHRELEVKLNKLSAIHTEVDKLRTKQDKKSQVMSLDSEIRLLNSKLQEFEEMQCSKQRLLTKTSGSAVLLKEAHFRKQMKSKFVAKLEQLALLLRSWESEEGRSFDSTLLSDDVRVLLSNPDQMENWIEKRTKLLPYRTVPTKATPRKRSFEEEKHSKYALKASGELTPPTKKQANTSRQTTLETSAPSRPCEKPVRSPVRQRKAGPRAVSENTPNSQQSTHDSAETTVPLNNRVTKVRRKDSTALPPFGRVLSELSSPDQQGLK